MRKWNNVRNEVQQHAPIPENIEKVGSIVLDSAYKIHTALGPGLLESAYETCLAFEIRQSGLTVLTQVVQPITYNNLKIDSGYRIDLLVENCVIVEIKAVEKTHSVHEAQLLTYMRLAGIRLGYLINFNVVQLKYGIKRMVL